MAKTLSPLVVIVGETASGKSDLAMSLAQQFKGGLFRLIHVQSIGAWISVQQNHLSKTKKK